MFVVEVHVDSRVEKVYRFFRVLIVEFDCRVEMIDVMIDSSPCGHIAKMSSMYLIHSISGINPLCAFKNISVSKGAMNVLAYDRTTGVPKVVLCVCR